MAKVLDPGAALRDMTLAQRVAQLFLFGFDGAEPSPGWLALLERYRFGGVSLYARHVHDPAQLARLNARLQAVAQAPPPGPAAGGGAAGGGLRGLLARLRPGAAAAPAASEPEFFPPLLVAAAQEGGDVVRLHHGAGFTHFPGAMAMAAAREEQSAFQLGLINGRECRDVGIHLNYGPCLDVLTPAAAPVMGGRCFSDSPEVVARWGMAFMRGQGRGGVGTCLKHFPGLGGVGVDTHLGPADVRDPLLQLEARDLAPFRLALEQGGVDAVMPSHAAYPALDRSGAPATFSADLITRLLREELRFGGAVISDALDMLAIKDRYEPEEIVVRAVHAGCDMLLVAADLDFQQALLAAAIAAAKSGRLDTLRLNMAVFRVLNLKKARNAGDCPDPEQAAGAVGTPEHRAEALRVARQAMTVLPGAPAVPAAAPYAVVARDPLPAAFAEALGAVPAAFGPEGPPPDWAGTVVLAARGDELAAAARALAERGQAAVLLLRGAPGAAAAYPPGLPALCCYDDSPYMLQAAAEALRGRLRCVGRAPVQLR